jgi:type IV secretory pathway TrbL component
MRIYIAGESPASAGYPVGTVVISGDGTGDQTVGSPDVNVLVGRTQVWSAPTGGQAKQQVVAKANRSQASKTHTSPESECEDEGNAETVIPS